MASSEDFMFFIAEQIENAKLYFLIEDKIEDRDWLSELVRITAKELRG